MVSVSTASVSITPTKEYLPCYICGNPLRDKKTDKIHDELECTIIVIKVNQKTLIWGEFDLIFLDEELSSSIRKVLEEKYKVPYECITLGATHTHSGPEISKENLFGIKEAVVVPGYRDFVSKKCLEAVAKCYEMGFTEVTPYIQTLEIEGLYGNRNNVNKISDQSMTLIKFKNKNNQIIAGCVNLACHPTVNNPMGMEISSDLFGYLSRRIKDYWGVSPLMMQGACGDISNRNYRQGADFNEVIRVGEEILNQIQAKASVETAVSISDVKIDLINFIDEYDRDQVTLDRLKQEIMEDEERLNLEKDFDQRKLILSGIAFLKMKIMQPHVRKELKCSIIRLGDLTICQIPSELFSCFGIEIKRASRSKYTIIWGYTNDDQGYLVEEDEYDKCYEGRQTDFRKGMPEKLTAKLVEVISK